jgi:hypothetical protein
MPVRDSGPSPSCDFSLAGAGHACSATGGKDVRNLQPHLRGERSIDLIF